MVSEKGGSVRLDNKGRTIEQAMVLTALAELRGKKKEGVHFLTRFRLNIGKQQNSLSVK